MTLYEINLFIFAMSFRGTLIHLSKQVRQFSSRQALIQNRLDFLSTHVDYKDEEEMKREVGFLLGLAEKKGFKVSYTGPHAT